MSEAIPSAGQANSTVPTSDVRFPPLTPERKAEVLAELFDGDARSQFDRMLAGEDYVGSEPRFGEEMARSAILQGRFNELSITDPVAAHEVLRELLEHVGEDVFVRAPLWVDYGFNITLGARTFVNMGLTALDVGKIVVGEDCLFGPNVQLLTPTHPLDPVTRRAKVEGSQPITIGDNVWLGGGVIVCPGVTIGDNSIIGAGSVVTKDIPANVVAVGNPARVIKEL